MTNRKIKIFIEENGKPVVVYDCATAADKDEQMSEMAKLIYQGFLPPFSNDEIKVLDNDLMETRVRLAAKYLLQAGYGDIKSALQEFINDIYNIIPDLIDKIIEKYSGFKPKIL